MMAISKCPNPTLYQKTLAVNDFYFGSEGLELPDGTHLVRRKTGCSHTVRRRSRDCPGWTLDLMAKHSLELLADVGGST